MLRRKVGVTGWWWRDGLDAEALHEEFWDEFPDIKGWHEQLEKFYRNLVRVQPGVPVAQHGVDQFLIAAGVMRCGPRVRQTVWAREPHHDVTGR